MVQNSLLLHSELPAVYYITWQNWLIHDRQLGVNRIEGIIWSVSTIENTLQYNVFSVISTPKSVTLEDSISLLSPNSLMLIVDIIYNYHGIFSNNIISGYDTIQVIQK